MEASHVSDDYGHICNFLSRYGVLADAGRWDEWVALYTDDAVLTVRGVEYRGHDEIRTAVADFHSFQMMRHLFHLPNVTFVDDGLVEAVSYVELRAVTGRSNDLEAIGMYEDRIVREGSDWRFAARSVTFDFWGKRGEKWSDQVAVP
jgi:3-phenylpropionate/cinnamic acid dioxygenase small subunit